jgi:hypothetical protein
VREDDREVVSDYYSKCAVCGSDDIAGPVYMCGKHFDEAKEAPSQLAEMTCLRDVAVREGDRLVSEFQAYRERAAKTEEALRTLWRYCEHECGDWWMKAERREIAMQVEEALKEREEKKR